MLLTFVMYWSFFPADLRNRVFKYMFCCSFRVVRFRKRKSVRNKIYTCETMTGMTSVPHIYLDIHKYTFLFIYLFMLHFEFYIVLSKSDRIVQKWSIHETITLGGGGEACCWWEKWCAAYGMKAYCYHRLDVKVDVILGFLEPLWNFSLRRAFGARGDHI